MFKEVQTLSDIEVELGKIAKKNKSIFNGDWGLANAKQTAKLLGNPQDSTKSIHISGTSGKGSTAYYLSALLIAHGLKVVTMVSPHIYDIRERAMVNLKYAKEENLAQAFNKLHKLICDGKVEPPSYYEAIVFFGFNLSDIEQPDYTVVESGLGGLLDSTNIISRKDKLSVITRLGLDHTEILGNTVEEIAKQKAGIMNHFGETVALKPDDQNVQKVLEDYAKKQNNKISYTKDHDLLELKDLVPSYQLEDMNIALSVFNKLADRDRIFDVDMELSIKTLKATKIPARWQEMDYQGRKIILDGAHNPQKIESLVGALKNKFDQKPAWLIGLKKDKDQNLILKVISEYSKSVGFCEFFRSESNERLQKMSESTEVLSSKWFKITGKEAIAISKTPKEAFLKMHDLLPSDVPIIITGSMYMISEFLKKLDFN